jgi:hypothetical protein
MQICPSNLLLADQPSRAGKSVPTTQQPTALHHRQLNVGHQSGSTGSQPCGGHQGLFSFPGGRRAGFCRELPSTGAQWNEVEIRQDVDRKPSVHPAQASAGGRLVCRNGLRPTRRTPKRRPNSFAARNLQNNSCGIRILQPNYCANLLKTGGFLQNPGGGIHSCIDRPSRLLPGPRPSAPIVNFPEVRPLFHRTLTSQAKTK